MSAKDRATRGRCRGAAPTPPASWAGRTQTKNRAGQWIAIRVCAFKSRKYRTNYKARDGSVLPAAGFIVLAFSRFGFLAFLGLGLVRLGVVHAFLAQCPLDGLDHLGILRFRLPIEAIDDLTVA